MGKEYHSTRHNVGMLALDYIVNKHNLSYKAKVKFIIVKNLYSNHMQAR